MSFQAKRLRVQLPSGETVVFANGQDDGGEAVAADEKIIEGQCINLVDPPSWFIGSCLDEFTTAIMLQSAPIATLDDTQLPALRAQLEQRLAEVTAAEQARAGGDG